MTPLAATAYSMTWAPVTLARVTIGTGCGYSLSTSGNGGPQGTTDFKAFQRTVDPVLVRLGFAPTTLTEAQSGSAQLASVDARNAYLTMGGRGVTTTVEVLVYLHDDPC